MKVKCHHLMKVSTMDLDESGSLLSVPTIIPNDENTYSKSSSEYDDMAFMTVPPVWVT